MIIRFAVENWCCFRNMATLNMTATRERHHKERVPVIRKFPLGVLPVTAIYGANASGKTKFVEALAFLRDLIVNGPQRDGRGIGVKPFALSATSAAMPARFRIDLLADEKIYSYYISIMNDRVLEERLTMENSQSSCDLFVRAAGRETVFDRDRLSAGETEALRLADRATREDAALLTLAASSGAEALLPVRRWFEDRLTVIGPDTGFGRIRQLADPGDLTGAEAAQRLFLSDTGIERFECEQIDLSRAERDLPPGLFAELRRRSADGAVLRCGDLIFRMREGGLVAERLLAVRRDSEGRTVRFDLADESGGTQRLLDLIPALARTDRPEGAVVVMDGLGQNLHPVLLEGLLRRYLSGCTKETRSQLIFTTHDVNLLNQDIFRRDELWGVERSGSGASELFSFGEFPGIRCDRDIRKAYLSGLMGAVPRIVG